MDDFDFYIFPLAFFTNLGSHNFYCPTIFFNLRPCSGAVCNALVHLLKAQISLDPNRPPAAAAPGEYMAVTKPGLGAPGSNSRTDCPTFAGPPSLQRTCCYIGRQTDGSEVFVCWKVGFVNRMSQDQMDLQSITKCLNVGLMLKTSKVSTCPQLENVHPIGTIF